MSAAVSCRQPSVLRRDSKKCTDISVQHSGMFNLSFLLVMFLYFLSPNSLQENSKEIKSHAPERLSCNGVEMIREYVSPQNIDDDYVYDVYFAEQVRFLIYNIYFVRKHCTSNSMLRFKSISIQNFQESLVLSVCE